ncbi:MAG TPA: ABC transporter permease [Acidobacteriaceae bacterium]|jgi:predicted permease|nr:ABC transporter permease [Acidobacteriaceae bacterium]
MLLHNLLQETRYALRQLFHNLSFTLLAVVTLALAIGANSTIVSWISATLLHPVPGAAESSRMITLTLGERNEHPSPPLSYADYADLRDNTKTLSGFLGYHDDYMAITGIGKPERIYGALVSANYFDVLGVHPVLGRFLLSSKQTEPAGQNEVVLNYDLWRNHFGADRFIVGRTVQINLHPYTVVGVAPQGFHGCKTGLRDDVWIPLGMARQVWGFNFMDDRGMSWLNVLGTLAPGVTRRQAENELGVLMQRIVVEYPTTHQGNNTVSTDPLWRSPFGANVYLSGTLPILLALAAVLLVLACANVANLLLVRAISRRREFAIRLSMGSGRIRLVRQLMIESLLLALAAGGLALLLTLWTARTMAAFMPPTTLPLTLNGSVDGSVLLVTVVISVLTAAIAGIIPALRSSHLSPMTVLKDEVLSTSAGLSRSRLAAALVIAQIALSTVLLTCAGLFVRSLNQAQLADPGFDPNHTLLATFNLDPAGYTAAAGSEFQRQVLNKLRALPGVQTATLADFSPLSFTIHSNGIEPEGYVPQPHESVEADRGNVGSEYLTTLRTPLLAGRDFTTTDRETTQPIAIVNQAFVDRYWRVSGNQALGKQVLLWGKWRTVVGVTANAKYRRLVYDPTPLVLLPLGQSYRGEVILHLRVAGDPLRYTPAVQQAVADLDPDLPLYNITTLQANMKMGNVFERIVVDFAGCFGVLALLLATVGLYGVIACTTKQRTHEIGIRIALGAKKTAIFRQILAQGLRLTLLGVVAGLATSLLITRFLRSLLYGIGVTDWITFSTVVLLLAVVALLASYLPARRATRVLPMVALRHE